MVICTKNNCKYHKENNQCAQDYVRLNEHGQCTMWFNKTGQPWIKYNKFVDKEEYFEGDKAW